MSSDGRRAIESLFRNRTKALELFKIVQSYIEGLGSVNTEATKTQISFGTDRKFAWVWLPQIWIKKQPDKSIVVTFSLDRRIQDERVKEAVEPRPGKWTHHVVIEKASDFDDDVRDWIMEAWDKSRRVVK